MYNIHYTAKPANVNVMCYFVLHYAMLAHCSVRLQ